MAGLNVVALISGGKDSLFSILHCQANGHKAVALANLHPPGRSNGRVDDMDSFMYQTIGHAVIPLYEQALALPLYRQEISGGAVNQEKSYAPRDINDETEDLRTLLQRVKENHPEINAVSSGAILSDYQRTRVESVAVRLGLIPLSYLWQWPTLSPGTQSSLLEDMEAVGQDARIIKVASGGLDSSFLAQNVACRRTIARLCKAAERFGSTGDGAVLGEGGEYESLAVSGPASLWKGRIKISWDDVPVVAGDAGAASLRISQASVAMNEVVEPVDSRVRIPPLLDERFMEMADRAMNQDTDSESSLSGLEAFADLGGRVEGDSAIVTLSEITGKGSTVAEQTHSIMRQIIVHLEANNLSADSIAYSTIILRDMADFAAINLVYGEYFVNPNPPARLTIACGDVLPSDANLMINIFAASGPRQGLHIQSRSYWAPANIGPYSQAISFPGSTTSTATRGSVFIAGQIPLVPATMNLPIAEASSPEEDFAMQSILALQHLYRIGQAMSVKSWTFGIVFITSLSGPAASTVLRAQITRRAWNAWHTPHQVQTQDSDQAEDFDVWNVVHGAGSTPWKTGSLATTNGTELVSTSTVPRLVVIEVDSLPRGASVEWVGFGRSSINEESAIPVHLHNILHVFRDRILSVVRHGKE